MTKEKLQAMYNEASEEALRYRAAYRELEALIENIEDRMEEIASEGAHYEAIVYHTIEAGATDTKGWLNDEEEGVEDEDEWDDDEDEWDDDEDEDEDEEEDEDEDDWEDEEYPECSKYNCVKCPRNDDCSRW